MTKEQIQKQKRRERRIARQRKADTATKAKKADLRFKVTPDMIARARRPIQQTAEKYNPFALPAFPPGVVPEGSKPVMAMDEFSSDQLSAALAWAEQQTTWSDGLQFLGYAFLAELSQRAEYRLVSERLAYEMTRKWIKFTTGETEEDKSERITQLQKAFEDFKVKDLFKTIAEQDGYYGRTHLYVDIEGAHDNRDELKVGIGDGTSAISKLKVKKGKLKRLVVVEPMWCYPANYNANDPTDPTWYKPETWLMMSKEIHATRLMPFVGRPVADILKPAYAFGGISLSQLVKFYIDKWLRNVNSVSDLIDMFSVNVLKTDMQSQLSGTGEDFFNRIDLFNLLRQNRGTLAIDKQIEDFTNVATPLGTLDVLLAQSLEHIAAASHIPIVILLGLSPAGLNASSEGELRAFYDWVLAFQEAFFRPGLTKVLHFIMLHLWGEIDSDITFAFEPLWAMDDKAKADKRKTEADTDVAYVGANILSPEEVRKRIAGDPDTPYQGLDAEDVPEPTDEEASEFDTEEEEAEEPSDEEAGGSSSRKEVGEDAVVPFGADKTEFIESDHPRGNSENAGQFAKKGGGTKSHQHPLLQGRITGSPKERSQLKAAIDASRGTQKRALMIRMIESLNTASDDADYKGKYRLADQLSDEAEKYLNSVEKMGFKESISGFTRILPASAAHDILDHIEEEYPRFSKYLSEEQFAAVATYSAEYYATINRALRKGTMNQKQKQYVKALNSALDRIKPTEGKVYRGAEVPRKIVAMYKPGKVVQEKAFTSTALSQRVAKDFMSYSGSVMFVIHSKTGREISSLSATGSHEKEVLFKAGTKFKVESNDGKTIVLREAA